MMPIVLFFMHMSAQGHKRNLHRSRKILVQFATVGASFSSHKLHYIIVRDLPSY